MLFYTLPEEERLKNIEESKKEQEEFFKQMDEKMLKTKPDNMSLDQYYLYTMHDDVVKERKHLEHIFDFGKNFDAEKYFNIK